MAFYRRWLLIFCALVLGGQGAMAATREGRDYAAAAAAFQTEMWSKAESAFAQFVQKYPKSTNAPMAVLLQAQAQFNQGKFSDVVILLANRRAQADSLADQYVLWTGEAQFAAGKFVAAADTFTSLADNFPDSPARLQATVEAAAAYGQLQQWSQLSALLEATNGVFERKADQDTGNELVSRGRLLLAQARFAQKDYAGASALLQMLNPQALKPELDWQRAYLLCHTKLASGELDAALAAALNLKQIAQLEKDDQHRAEGVVLQADILEKLGRAGDAMTAYQENFTPGTPDDKQRESILKYAELAAGQKQFSVAGQALDNFLKQFPDSPQADSAMLASGELLLKDYDLQGTNNLPAAKAKFDQLLAKHPSSTLAGKALLDRGWCQWLAGKTSESLADFDAAARKKLSPEDLAVAKFKAGDVLFAQKDFKGALEHYRGVYPGAVLDNTGGQPSAERELGGRAMYQSLRACLELGDAVGAADAFAKIFQIFSGDELGQDSALLYGESLVKPGDARALFEKLAPNFSGSPLEPQLKLAIARTYEQEQDWPAAITNYEGWIRDCPTNSLRPQVDYALALANFHAGNEAGALALFTRFVAQNPANALAPQAQWWVADHFFRLGGTNYLDAEKNYEDIFQNTNAAWKTNLTLVYPAQLMAGRSAMGRAGYKDAVSYFTQLFSDTNCPDDYLKVKARFACGAARMQMDSSDTNATFINLQTATNLFSQVVQLYPTNELGARAWGEIGDCAQQLGDYVTATNAYAQVFGANSTADISARSRAEVGYGLVLEKMADQTGGIDKTNLLNLALDDYLDVFYASNRRDGEVPDAFWVKKAGLQAAPLVRSLFDLRRQKIFYLSLQTNLPPLAEKIQAKIDALPPE